MKGFYGLYLVMAFGLGTIWGIYLTKETEVSRHPNFKMMHCEMVEGPQP